MTIRARHTVRVSQGMTPGVAQSPTGPHLAPAQACSPAQPVHHSRVLKRRVGLALRPNILGALRFLKRRPVARPGTRLKHPPVEAAQIENTLLSTLHHLAPAGRDVGHVLAGQPHIVLTVGQIAVLGGATRGAPLVIKEDTVDQGIAHARVPREVVVDKPIYQVGVASVP
eukprot:CAMPEP_0206286034 /NCGR_PEP_ID=MMETSP0106_2-20121207/397_1 /ASSEMBLY_ACC=CAM_ASM_000206 /TAXON_ID=81532 /ORGANISM="Acanthoeca-like sp., Strain 10tr" /LENGTH=169 /DNA_ID=CAMNT_0053716553 /DNA_START=174 /DNA_END=684 /DNA_ORIENTATION=+